MSNVNISGTKHLSESGAMPLVNADSTELIKLADGRSVLWGGREHVTALRTVWPTLTPLAQNMVRELFPSVVKLITTSYVSVVDVIDPVSGQTTKQRRDMGF